MTTAEQETLKPTFEGGHKVQHLTFIHEMATHGRQRRAYMAAYPGCTPETADRGAHRLMSARAGTDGEKPEIRTAIEISREEIYIARQQMLEENLATQLIHVQEKRGVLKQIYKGELQNTTYNKDGVVIKRTENVGQRMQAVRLDGKLLKEELSLLQQLAEAPSLAAQLFMQNSEAAPAFAGYDALQFGAQPDFFTEEEIYATEEQLNEENRQGLQSEIQKTGPKTGYNRTSPDMNNEKPDLTKTGSADNNGSAALGNATKDKGWKNSGLYAALPPEERAELDQIRQRYMAAKAATDKVLYGSMENGRVAVTAG